MAGTLSPDGKTVAFDFADVSGSSYGYMDAAAFTIIDADHHAEEGGVKTAAGNHLRAHMNLTRAN